LRDQFVKALNDLVVYKSYTTYFHIFIFTLVYSFPF
jgi:hypothetical protein